MRGTPPSSISCKRRNDTCRTKPQLVMLFCLCIVVTALSSHFSIMHIHVARCKGRSSQGYGGESCGDGAKSPLAPDLIRLCIHVAGCMQHGTTVVVQRVNNLVRISVALAGHKDPALSPGSPQLFVACSMSKPEDEARPLPTLFDCMKKSRESEKKAGGGLRTRLINKDHIHLTDWTSPWTPSYVCLYM